MKKWTHTVIGAGLATIFMALTAGLSWKSAFLTQGEEGLARIALHYLGSAALIFAAVIYVIAFVVTMYRKNRSPAVAMLLSSTFLISAILAAPHIRTVLKTESERRYIERIGSEKLRQEAGLLVGLYEELQGQHGYLGKPVEADNLPPHLQRFSRGHEMEVNREGVVFRTHGLGSWRAGYMITPEDTDATWEGARVIQDGFYFVTSR